MTGNMGTTQASRELAMAGKGWADLFSQSRASLGEPRRGVIPVQVVSPLQSWTISAFARIQAIAATLLGLVVSE